MAHQILEKLAKQREQMVALVEGMSDEQMEQPVDGSWRVRDVLAHLLNAEEDHCRVIAVALRGDADQLPRTIDLDGHNAARLQGRGRMTRDELLAAMATQRERTEALFQRVGEAQLDLDVRHPALGETTVGKIFRIIGLHEKMHLREIETALADTSPSGQGGDALA